MNKRQVLRLFFRRKLSLVGLGCVILCLIMIVFADLLAPYDPQQINLNQVLAPPSTSHIFGTDELGRDVWSRILYGSRWTFLIGLSGVAFGLVIGGLIGLISGYLGGLLDDVVMRFIDVLYAFPGMILAIIIVAVAGPGLWGVILAIGVFSTSVFARITRASVLEVKSESYVEAARAIGASSVWILRRHILVNIVMPIIVMATTQLAQAVLVAASLGFLGLGVPPSTPEWGAILSRGRAFLREAPHVTVFPGLFISVSVFGIHIMGDVLRDVIDPRYRTEG